MRKALRKCLRMGGWVGEGAGLSTGSGGWLEVFYMFSRLGSSSLVFHHQTDSCLLLFQAGRPKPVTPTNENIYQLTHKHTEYLHR